METEKRGIWQAPLLLVSVAHKDGWLKKIWSPSNCHKFSNGDQSFLVIREGGMPHFFQTSWRKLSKKYDNSLLWWLKKFGHHPKNSDGRMVGDRKSLVAPPCPILIAHLWWFKIFSCHKDGWLKKFGQPPLWRSKFFDRHSTHPHHWMAT